MSFSPQRIKGSSTPERGVAKGLRSGASPSRWRSFRSKWRALGLVAVLLGTLSLAAPVATADPVTPVTTHPVSLTAAGTILAPAFNGGRGGNNGVLSSPDGKYLYVQTFTYILKVDLASFTNIERIDLSGGPMLSVISPDKNTGYVATYNFGDGQQRLESLNLITGVVNSTISLQPAGNPLLGSIESLTVGHVPNVGTMLYAYSPGTNWQPANPQLLSIDPATGAVTSIDLNATLGIARASSGYHVALSADGTRLFLGHNDSIRVFETANLSATSTVLASGGVNVRGGNLKVWSDGSPLGLIYALSTSAKLRVIDPANAIVVTEKQLIGQSLALDVRSNGDAVVSFIEPYVSYFDRGADVVTSVYLSLDTDSPVRAVDVAFDENSTFGTCIFTANNTGNTFSAVSVDGADCGTFASRFGQLPAVIGIDTSASMSINPPGQSSREAGWVGIGVFEDGALARVVKPPFGSNVDVVWADYSPGAEVRLRSYYQAHLDAAQLASVDDVDFDTDFRHERSTRLGYLGFEAEQIASGYNSCAISGGSLYCWGGNWAGQMGDGGTDYLLEATKVPSTQEFANSNVTQVAFGEDHVCAVDNGSVFCWGSNSNGELGNATTTNSNRPEKVMDVAGVFTNSGVTAISTGRYHTCAVASGSVFCWGLNNSGQLGNGSTSQSSVSAKVADVDGVFSNTAISAVSAGHLHTCAVASGSLFCWGHNQLGQLGNGSTSQSSVSAKVAGVLANATVSTVSAGDLHTCAIASGSVYCWGSDSFAQLGNGPGSGTTLPGLVLDGEEGFTNVGVSMLSSFWDHTCALKNGAMYCWGRNDYSQLGINSVSNQQLPVKVLSVTGGFTNSSVTSIAVGWYHTCAIDDGVAYCWGPNWDGQHGNLTFNDSGLPVSVCCKVEAASTGGNGGSSGPVSTPVPVPVVTPERRPLEIRVVAPEVSGGVPTLVTQADAERLRREPGAGGVTANGLPVDTEVIMLEVPGARVEPTERTAEQVQAIQEAAADLVEMFLGEGESDLAISVTNTPTGATITGLLLDPRDGETAVAVPAEDVVLITGGNLRVLLSAADTQGQPAKLVEGRLEVTDGGAVSALAKGLPAGVPGEVVLFSTPTLLAGFTTSAQGSFAGQVDLPAGIEPGPHTVVLLAGEMSSSLGVVVLASIDEATPVVAPGELPAAGAGVALMPWLLLILFVGGALVFTAGRRERTS
jgi:alpha-tubulin suppressor-like RCC1 family protein